MAKKHPSNQQLANHYKKSMELLGYGPQQQKIYQGIRDCKISFYEYSLRHKGKLDKLYSNNQCREISSRTLSLLETLIQEMTGTAAEEKKETVKNKSEGFIVRMRPSTADNEYHRTNQKKE